MLRGQVRTDENNLGNGLFAIEFITKQPAAFVGEVNIDYDDDPTLTFITCTSR